MDPLSARSSKSLFEQFLTERRYLKNVTPATIEWYETAFKAWQRASGADSPPLTKPALQQFVVSLRQRGVKPISCNTWIRALNTFCLGAHGGASLGTARTSPLKVEKRILQTLTDEQMQALLSAEAQAVRSIPAARARLPRARYRTPHRGGAHAATARCRFRQPARDRVRQGPQGAARSVLVRAAEGAVSVGPEEDGSVSSL